ncbi:MAG: ATP-binding cassette domain-containing protein [Chthonomonas sp.]|nr:ATP-binding cassette domain-containing protein [Chthonomonas sp.]
MAMPSPPKLTLQGITKRFGSLVALDGISIEFIPGQIHAVLGENGAGKSTLMNVIGGFLRPDSGAARFEPGHELPLGDPSGTRAAGIEMVHQHFMLIPEFTVIENLALATIGSLSGPLDLPFDRFNTLLTKLGWEVDLHARTGSLPVGAQQRVEILKALATDGPVLILDEPTAVLSESEVNDLNRVLRELRDSGKIVILIAHKLAEVLAIADWISVLRNGKLVGSVSGAMADETQLKSWILGDSSSIESPAAQPTVASDESEFVLRAHDIFVRGDRGEEAVAITSLGVKRGEIVGIGGVDGNGQVELAEAVVGIRHIRSGQLRAIGKVGYIPQDRQVDGLALEMSIKENFEIKQDSDLVVLPSVVSANARSLIEKYNIKANNINNKVASLSGGNQQKVVVSRVLEGKPDLIVAVNPTRGLDFSATQFVHDAIRLAAREGAGVLLITADRDEFRELATKFLYIDRGNVHDQGWVR